MKAVIFTQYGPPDVLHLAEVAQPTPKDNQVLIRVHATPVNFGDLMARNFKAVTPGKFNMPFPLWLLSRLIFGLNKPRINILGSEFAGEVAAIGAAVTRFRPGDQVFGYVGQNMGAYAEYLCVAEDSAVAHKPANLSIEQAAALPYGALMALGLLRKADIQPGQKVLINGASGGIGSAAVQLAKAYGAEVTGVCSTPRMEYVKALGADKVIDYTRQDFTRSGERYDLIFDILGRSTFADCKGVLTPKGRYLLASFKMKQLFQMLSTRNTDGQKVICSLTSESQANLLEIKALVEAGKLTALIDQCYPLEQAAAAHRYIEQGHKKGAVVLLAAHSQ